MKTYREAAGFSRKQAAVKLEISEPTISRWEAGLVMPSDERKIEIAELYGVLPATIFPWKKVPA